PGACASSRSRCIEPPTDRRITGGNATTRRDHMRSLVGLVYSPWTQRARWALDHHRVVYRSEPYTPLLGELALRRRLGRFRGRVSVPVLFTDAAVIDDSVAIARHAEAVGSGGPRFADADAVTRWVALAG